MECWLLSTIRGLVIFLEDVDSASNFIQPGECFPYSLSDPHRLAGEEEMKLTSGSLSPAAKIIIG